MHEFDISIYGVVLSANDYTIRLVCKM